MKAFIKQYRNPAIDKINRPLINKEYDGDIVDYIIDCCKSLEVLEYIKFTGYSYVDDESKIDTSEYISAKARGKQKNPNISRYMYLEDTRCGELRLKFHLDCNGESADITKKILVPIPNRDQYYTIKGKKYFLMYQVVDSSTYTTKTNLTLKSMMPISLTVVNQVINDVDKNDYKVPTYMVQLFKKNINIILFYLARFGYKKTLQYFSLDQIIEIFPSYDKNNEDIIVFPISSKLFLSVNKRFFNKYQYVRTMVALLLGLMNNRMSMDHLNDKEYWINYLGALGTTNKNNQYEKGINTLTFFDRMLDDTTRKILKVHDMHKQDIYSIIRWLVMHFEDLRKKDNLDLNNRRLRCNEYVAALLTTTFSERINRVISLGKKATLKKVKDVFKFQGDILITQLHKSQLLRFNDSVNDASFFAKLRITMKGPNSLGGTNENNIIAKYRGLDPSYIGKIDLNVCGTSDPGTGAVLTPQCETDGLYFNDAHEPEDFKYNLDKDIFESITQQMYDIWVNGSFETLEDYFDYQLGIEKISKYATAEETNFHLISVPDSTEEDDDDDDSLDEDIDIIEDGDDEYDEEAV